MKAYIQQGDVLLKRCRVKGIFKVDHDYPSDGVPVSGNVLYYGDNNTHEFKSGEFEMVEKDGIRFVRAFTETKLSHGEHGDQIVDTDDGGFFLDIVIERDHLKEESRRVID